MVTRCTSTYSILFSVDILTRAGIVVRDFFKTDEATKENVKHALHSAIWGHFACHGDLDKNTLVLADLDKNALVLAIPSDINAASCLVTNLSMIEVQRVWLAKAPLWCSLPVTRGGEKSRLNSGVVVWVPVGGRILHSRVSLER